MSKLFLARALPNRSSTEPASIRGPKNTSPFEQMGNKTIQVDLMDKDSLLLAMGAALESRIRYR